MEQFIELEKEDYPEFIYSGCCLADVPLIEHRGLRGSIPVGISVPKIVNVFNNIYDIKKFQRRYWTLIIDTNFLMGENFKLGFVDTGRTIYKAYIHHAMIKYYPWKLIGDVDGNMVKIVPSNSLVSTTDENLSKNFPSLDAVWAKFLKTKTIYDSSY